MRRDLEKYLVKKFPLCFGDYGKSMQETCMCWGLSCNRGWYKIIKEACEKLEPLIQKWIEEHKNEKDYNEDWIPRFSQVKEKYGTLSIYWASATDEMYAISDEAERLSAETCETCGKEGKLRGGGWLYTSCYKCAKDEDKDNLEIVEDAYEKKENKTKEK
jgi:hypothetical protein